MEDQKANAQNRCLIGRQIYLLILHSFKTNPHMGVVYGLKRYGTLRWLGYAKLETFWNNWLSVDSQQRSPLPESQRAEILLDLIDGKCNELSYDLAEYKRRQAEGLTAPPDYEYLQRMIQRHISQMNQIKNNSKLTDAYSKTAGSVATGAAAPQKAACKFFGTAKGCTMPDCRFYRDKSSKPKPQGGGMGGPGSKGPARASGSGGPGGGTDIVCFRFLTGSCPHTAENCKYTHRSLRPDEKPAFDKYKADVKARAKAAKGGAPAPKPKPKAKGKAKAS